MNMVEAKRRNEWSMTSEILAAIYNTVRDTKKRKKPFVGTEFNPWETRKRQTPAKTVSITEWRKLCGGKLQTK